VGGCIALIVAAGRGNRAGPGAPKQYRRIGGEPVLRRCLRPFLAHGGVDAVRVVIHRDDEAAYREAVAGFTLLEPVIGGATRQDSVRLGLESLVELAPRTVLVHDAARPFVSAGVIERVMAALAAGAKGAIAALPVVDTLKLGATDAGARPVIARTVPREGLWRAQTPQGFDFRAILEAHRRGAAQTGLTDDAQVMEICGEAVVLVQGEEDNIKLTSEEDLRRAAARVGDEIRTGSGFDVHRLGVGDHVMLAGVRVPHDQGLIGHSDADVALHALTDALLGAVAAGDIGLHFPPSDPRWRGASSDQFLAHAAALVAQAGGTILNVDVTLICERPRIGPHRAAMTSRIASILAVSPERVSVKATTTERLGFTGREEGIAAQAVATVRLPSPPPG
jgi:2-C-methyl-D-erythritol 4-phosphate cytidylyltransferase/2-C-methyl-D-erythritol 2,4-cyclodiphosphate synthase